MCGEPHGRRLCHIKAVKGTRHKVGDDELSAVSLLGLLNNTIMRISTSLLPGHSPALAPLNGLQWERALSFAFDMPEHALCGCCARTLLA